LKRNVLIVTEVVEFLNKHKLHLEFSKLNLLVLIVLELELSTKRIEKFLTIDDLKIKKKL
jgi:hypothetical protein